MLVRIKSMGLSWKKGQLRGRFGYMVHFEKTTSFNTEKNLSVRANYNLFSYKKKKKNAFSYL